MNWREIKVNHALFFIVLCMACTTGSGQGLESATDSQTKVYLPVVLLEGGQGTPPPAWGMAERIDVDNGRTDEPQVAMDPNGNAIAVWEQWDDGTRANIWSNRYEAGVGWGTPLLLESDNAKHPRFPKVAMDSAGHAIAVWQQWQQRDEGVDFSIRSNRYEVGVGWGTTPLRLDSGDGGGAVGSQVAMNSAGHAIAVWYQSDGTRNNIWANRYEAGVGWGTPMLLESDDTVFALFPQVAIDSAGHAIAVWQQWDGTRNNIWANRYEASVGWGTPILFESDDAGDANFPQVAMNSAGHAIAVWYQWDGTRNNIWANRYQANIGWGTPLLLESDNAENASSPQVAMDSAGHAIAVWQQSDGTRVTIWANRYQANIGWGTPTLLESGNGGDALFPQVVIDSADHAIVVWEQSDGTRVTIWANRFEYIEWPSARPQKSR